MQSSIKVDDLKESHACSGLRFTWEIPWFNVENIEDRDDTVKPVLLKAMKLVFQVERDELFLRRIESETCRILLHLLLFSLLGFRVGSVLRFYLVEHGEADKVVVGGGEMFDLASKSCIYRDPVQEESVLR